MTREMRQVIAGMWHIPTAAGAATVAFNGDGTYYGSGAVNHTGASFMCVKGGATMPAGSSAPCSRPAAAA